MDNCEDLIPEYVNFILRHMVDSEDLLLNISELLMSEFIAAETDSRRTLVRFEAKFEEHDFSYL